MSHTRIQQTLRTRRDASRYLAAGLALLMAGCALLTVLGGTLP